jgi:hypothetical protein
MVLAGKTLSPTGRNGSWAGSTVLGPWAKAGLALCGDFFLLIFLFSIIISEIVETSKMHRKCHTTQKNMKQISIESLRADLHREMNLTLFCSIMHYTKLQELKY